METVKHTKNKVSHSNHNDLTHYKNVGKIRRMRLVAHRDYVHVTLLLEGLRGNNFRVLLKENVLTICFFANKLMRNGSARYNWQCRSVQQCLTLPYIAYDRVVAARNISGVLNIVIAKKGTMAHKEEQNHFLDEKEWQKLPQYAPTLTL